jgi:RimJ/RimL family protein N-acetyltransferase
VTRVGTSSGPPAIVTARLRLEPLRPESIRALIAGDRRSAERAARVELPAEFPDAHDVAGFLPVQLRRMEQAPHRTEWTVRLMVLRRPRLAVGHIGFHGPPELVGRAEIGYTVFAEHRRRGYATEAVRALVDFAAAHRQPSVFLSIGSSNVPSLAIARRLGFHQVGVEMDEVDGEELVFELGLR